MRQRFDALPGHQQGLLAVLGAAVLWSTGGLLIKSVTLDALGVTMWRSLFAAAAIVLLTRTVPPAPWRAGGLQWALALSYAFMLVFFVTATKLTTAANAIFLQYTAPLYVLVFSRFLLEERARTVDLVCVAVAFGGMALFFVGRLQTEDLWGNLSAVTSGLAFAVFLTLLRRRECGPKTRPQAMTLGNVLLVVGLLVVNVARGEGAAFTPGGGDLAALLFLGVFQIGLAYALFGFGIERVQALEASLIGMLEPVLNPAWVFLFLGETPGWWAAAGGAVIVAAVAVRTFVAERRRPASAPELTVVHSEA